MVFDFDRYLAADTDTGSLDVSIQRPYAEWSSYCYGCSGSRLTSDQPKVSIQSLTSISSSATGDTGSRLGSIPRHWKKYQIGTKAGVQTSLQKETLHIPEHGISNPIPNDQLALNEDIHLEEDIKDPTNSLLRNNEPTNSLSDSGNESDTEGSGSDGDIRMPRPQGQEFGNRLGWTQLSHHKLPRPDGPLRRRKPALGVNGLTFHNKSNSCNLLSKENNSDTRCYGYRTVTTSVRTFSGAKTCSVKTGIHDILSGSVHNQIYTKVEQSQVCVTSDFKSSICDDTIAEVSSEEETSSNEERELESKDAKSRKVSFADECGKNLVKCVIFERDEDDLGYGSFSPIIDISDSDVSESDSEDFEMNKSSEDTPANYEMSPRKKMNILAAATYRSVHEDLKNVKLLLQQNREFFENLCPDPEQDKSGQDLVNTSNESTFDLHQFSHHSIGCKPFDDVSSDDKIHQSSTSKSSNLNVTTEENKSSCDNAFRDIAEVTCKFSNFILPQQSASDDLDKMVGLETLSFDQNNKTLSGQIMVRNVSFHKNVSIRYTTTHWNDYQDKKAVYKSNSDQCTCLVMSDNKCTCIEHGQTQKWNFDKFEFRLELPDNHMSNDKHPGNFTNSKIEFAICFEENMGKCHWDNNHKRNYVLQFLNKS